MASSALIRQFQRNRAEIAALLARYEAIVRQLKFDLAHVEETIRALEPDVPLSAPGKLRTHSKMAPIILETIRLSEHGCTVRELAMHVMAARGIDTGNRKLLGEITERVSGLLRHYRKRGIARSIRQGAKFYWEIVPGQDD